MKKKPGRKHSFDCKQQIQEHTMRYSKDDYIVSAIPDDDVYSACAADSIPKRVKRLQDIDTGASSGWVQAAEDRKLKRDIATEIPDELLLAVYKEMWEGSKLYDDITEYLISKSLIESPKEIK